MRFFFLQDYEIVYFKNILWDYSFLKLFCSRVVVLSIDNFGLFSEAVLKYFLCYKFIRLESFASTVKYVIWIWVEYMV